MVEINKSITLTGSSKINGVQAVYMSASIEAGSNSANVTKTITDKDLYNANKDEARKDVSEFESAVYAIEDAAVKEIKAKGGK